MKVTFDPLPGLRELAEADVRLYFQMEEQQSVNDAEHVLKQQAASMSEPPDWFVQHAELEGMTVEKYRDVILSKPNPVLERATARRKLIIDVRNATSHAALDEMLTKGGLDRRYDYKFFKPLEEVQ